MPAHTLVAQITHVTQGNLVLEQSGRGEWRALSTLRVSSYPFTGVLMTVHNCVQNLTSLLSSSDKQTVRAPRFCLSDTIRHFWS